MESQMKDYNKCMKGKKPKTLCLRGYCSAKARYESYPSAYANLHASSVCKGLTADVSGVTKKDKEYMKYINSLKSFSVEPYSSYVESFSVEPVEAFGGGLRRWLREDWRNVCAKSCGSDYKNCPKCGRAKASLKSSTYPYCRPLHRISKDTPKTIDELGPAKLRSMCRKKRKKGAARNVLV